MSERMRRLVWLRAGIVLACVAGGVEHAQAGDAVAGRIEAIVREAANPALRWPRFPDHRQILGRIYQPRGFAPLWLEGGRPTKQARDAIDALGRADAQGLDPGDYDFAWLEERGRALDARGATSEEQALFDTGLTVGLVRNVSDLRVGRVNPRNLGFGYEVDPGRYDFAELVTAAVQGDRVSQMVADAPPALTESRLLVEQLARYQRIAQTPSAIAAEVSETLHPGDPFPDAAGLARWLTALGDLPAASGARPPVYDGALVDATKRFQARHGLTPDGVIGRDTARALAVPASRRVRQIELALERLRWIPPLDPGRLVVVNIPGFELRAFDQVDPPARSTLSMRVIVGRAMRTQTPAFAGVLRTVVFSPYWNVPRSITRKEILPKARRDPGYLAREEMEIVSGSRVLPDGASSLAQLEAGGAELRERPGPHNALGRVKFLFPNSHSVYLHDTPGKQAFERSRRDFSHGCIRVAEAEAFAQWVLRGREDWPPERIREAMEAGRETSVRVDPPVPVVIYYTTAVAEIDGTIRFYEDIYGQDAALERALAAGYPRPS